MYKTVASRLSTRIFSVWMGAIPRIQTCSLKVKSEADWRYPNRISEIVLKERLIKWINTSSSKCFLAKPNLVITLFRICKNSKYLPFQTQTKRKHNPVTVNNVRISLEEIWNVCIFVEGNFFMRYITNIVGTRVDIAVYLDIQDVIRICTSCEILSVLHVFCVSCPAHHLCW